MSRLLELAKLHERQVHEQVERSERALQEQMRLILLELLRWRARQLTVCGLAASPLIGGGDDPSYVGCQRCNRLVPVAEWPRHFMGHLRAERWTRVFK